MLMSLAELSGAIRKIAVSAALEIKDDNRRRFEVAHANPASL